MRHKVKHIKFKFGQDSNQMLIRKLLVSFLKRSKIEITLAKAKILKSVVEKIVEKAKTKTEANKNYLLKKLAQDEVIDMLFNQIGPALKDKVGGYVRIIKIGQRDSDGASMARLEWVYPIVLDKKAK